MEFVAKSQFLYRRSSYVGTLIWEIDMIHKKSEICNIAAKYWGYISVQYIHTFKLY